MLGSGCLLSTWNQYYKRRDNYVFREKLQGFIIEYCFLKTDSIFTKNELTHADSYDQRP